MSEPNVDIVKRAEQLALTLTAGSAPVGRNVFLGIVSDFQSAPRPDRDRLSDIVRLVQQGSGGHLKRGGGYGEQVKTAAVEISRVLEEDLSDQDLQSLFGWTARLLLVRREARPEGRQEARPGASPQKGKESRSVKPREDKSAARMGSLDQKSLSTLEMLKQKLSGAEPPKKG
jgi:hypothetical protein